MNILDKYNFTHEKDKKIFEDFLNKLNFSDKQLQELIEMCLNKNTEFDSRILYNPIELLDAILEKDLSWSKIDSDEVEKIIEKLSFFEKFYKWEISEKEFLEKKYGIKIILLNEELELSNAWIFWHKLSKSQQMIAFNKIERLLSFYPISFIKNINLANIIVASYFYKKDNFWTTILWGFETLSDNNIYLALRWIETSFHHELFHQAMQYYNDFDLWRNIRKEQDKNYLYENLDKQVEWFARNYGKENVAEDQATIAEELITNYHNLTKRIKKDKILKEKVKLVLKAFENISEWKMNKDFWISKFRYYILD